MQNEPDTVMDRNYSPEQTARTAEPSSRPPSSRAYHDDPRRKSPVLALVLSLMPGVGQIYVGYYNQGFFNALVAASIIAMLNSEVGRGNEPFLGVFLGFFWMYNVVDAWRRAVFYNNALAGLGPATLPEDFTIAAGKRGSLAAGAGLMLVGGILLSHTVFNVPLDWLDRWWPVAFILVGVWLAYSSLSGRKRTNAA